MGLKKDYDKTLAWVNKIRASMGDPVLDEILTGVPHSSLKCPLANSIGHHCFAGTRNIDYIDPRPSYKPKDSLHVATNKRPPSYVRRFIRNFDNGLYPELEVNREDLITKDIPAKEVAVV